MSKLLVCVVSQLFYTVNINVLLLHCQLFFIILKCLFIAMEKVNRPLNMETRVIVRQR